MSDLQQLIERASALTEGELVTRALARDVALPGGGGDRPGTAVLITLDNGQDHTRPNTLGPRSLGELNTALDTALARADAGEISAIMITGKPFILAAGADLTGVPKITDRTQAGMIAELGHAVFAKLGDTPADHGVPTFCFVNGLALGGGLEIALNSTYRTVSAAARGIGLPECFLGMLPGWGGAWLLPNLIGAERAIGVIIENALSQNRMLSGPQVAELGIADAIFDGADFLAASITWAAGVVRGEITVERPAVDRGEAWDAAVAAGRRFAVSKIGKAAPGPHRALDLIAAAKTSTRDEGFAAENEALADLLMSDQLRAGLYSFELVQKRARKPAGAPESWLSRDVGKVGVVGAGLMATQLALLFARRLGVPVVITDLDQGRVDAGLARIAGELDGLADKGRISTDQRNRFGALVSGTTDYADFADCDFVIEAVFEELGAKQQVFAALEQHVGAECVLATNTSSLSVTAMAEGLAHPERLIGFHFFNPVAVLPLLEVVRTPSTDDATTATALAVAKGLRKNAVLVKDAPAFVVNRLLTRMMGEVLGAIEEGTPIEVADTALRPLGLPMSTLTLLQLVGPAVALHVAETLHDAFGDRFGVSAGLQKLVASGRRTIADVGPDGTPVIPDEVRAMFSGGTSPSTPEQICDRALAALTEEVGLMLAEGVVAAPMDIDLCLILGAGWPFHNGGIVPLLDREGWTERLLGRRLLPPGAASVAA
ncbi:3-hydroxyacyl-CoA dehydrogenase/enoyl-CoA hydratase/carnithine racemase [Friedmanniella endophytica]|uniref:3-hydroxyacyl-CoA dehydrogenase/enoyl-CoA hydratase/carnithine racemase n=1 Tax=Microlunatus kandeliicorticis TaxID=1759536 RepID=A0A7W3ITC8_9ACTN|nr:3-hydroxyacyl-CoA dehydrogenase NAD-binding domain-containing protein [Microlunatus kandeliicorticis]MBA8794882.1 3-hydroxyacyl-CoA dehydrogenase/enoyl-CoA hydratase/carnithine racemase [Microlunatus kandeliicorticis]